MVKISAGAPTKAEKKKDFFPLSPDSLGWHFCFVFSIPCHPNSFIFCLRHGFTYPRITFNFFFVFCFVFFSIKGMELSAEALKVLHPREVFSRFAVAGSRPDGRALNQARKLGINTLTLTTCDGSAVVRLGGTTVAAGVQVILAENPLTGGGAEPPPAVVVSLQIPAACSTRFRRTGFTDPGAGRAATIAELVSNLLRLPEVLDKAQFNVSTSTSFRLEVDAICTTFDGNIEDATILAVVCAISTTVLPGLRKRANGSWALSAEVPSASHYSETPEIPARCVLLSCVPVPLTFACIRIAAAGTSAETLAAHGSVVIVSDPTSDEEALSSCTLTVVAALELSADISPCRVLCVSSVGEPLRASDLTASTKVAFENAAQRSAELKKVVNEANTSKATVVA